MSNHEHDSAFLSNLVYSTPHERTQHLLNKNYQVHYHDDEFLSASRGNNLYNVHRGTTPTLRDLYSDLSLAVGSTNHSRFADSLKKSQYHASLHGRDKTVYEVGHSLGGTIAEYVARKLGHRSISYNPGTSPLLESHLTSGSQRIRTSDDFVSSFKPATKTINPKKRKYPSFVANVGRLPRGFQTTKWLLDQYDSHKMSNFLIS